MLVIVMILSIITMAIATLVLIMLIIEILKGLNHKSTRKIEPRFEYSENQPAQEQLIQNKLPSLVEDKIVTQQHVEVSAEYLSNEWDWKKYWKKSRE